SAALGPRYCASTSSISSSSEPSGPGAGTEQGALAVPGRPHGASPVTPDPPGEAAGGPEAATQEFVCPSLENVAPGAVQPSCASAPHRSSTPSSPAASGAGQVERGAETRVEEGGPCRGACVFPPRPCATRRPRTPERAC